ncbi:MAG: rod shape-determining protein [Candidatus Nitronauta litoralis]|uniref:Cell shape-determining protein MreB n=1 Tax=Candidatus Nitronauta litoralis TaxID=2705533 RepID=A0A7T0BTV5_9BACT|nr:MAG: rod shape-determining protein [Candidatus Nitronauta litoralis]
MFGRLFKNFKNLFNSDVAMDLGTANTLVYVKNGGIVLDEPSVVAISTNGNGKGHVEAVGLEAKRMFGRTHAGLETIRPMKDGVIADFNMTNSMITTFINKVMSQYWFLRPRMVVGVPTCITQVEKKAVIDAAKLARVREVYLIEEPMAAAIGVGIPVHKAEGNLVIDIGGGTTDVAVTALSAIAYGESIRIAGDEMDEAIVRYIRLKHHMNIGIFEAERVKIEIGSAYPLEEEQTTEVKGMNIKTGVPTSIIVNDTEIREAMREPVASIVSVVMRALEKTPPELSSDIHSNGLYLTGGGALIRGLDKLIEERTGLRTYVPDQPLLSIVKGAGAVLDNFSEMRKVCIN